METRPTLQEMFDHLHKHPEISWQEANTTDFIVSILEKTKAKVKRFEDFPGLVAELGSGQPVIAIRADMDALWQEVDGTHKANHSCGHDAHMSIVLETLFALEEKQSALGGTVRFIFQPAEETMEGAKKMVEKGLVDDVDYLYGLHLRPIQELRTGQFAAGIKHGAARFLEGTITGEDAHGARPHLNKNAIELGAEIIQMINNIHLDPMVPHSAKVTSFHSGGKSTNIIPGSATFSIDLRAQTNELMDELTGKIEAIIDAVSNLYGASVEVNLKSDAKAAVLNDDAVTYMERGIERAAGPEALNPVIETTGGDDFHFYTIKRPDLKASMLAIGCDLQPGLHHPQMAFDHKVMPEASRILVETVMETLGEG
ncbi:M20 peptidase aminoacylase family protein [Halobacillus litoralis]|uniref:Amidohydrolase n=1 Tax=Halobacillus litoralis TaxID=45668 RepID=A0A410MFP0_9BACI|nr:M20 peptidase aminoacylase family protein [Halobacillus litoralis]QAS53518.1 amidohydrolase [Halobacillus litoralis]